MDENSPLMGQRICHRAVFLSLLRIFFRLIGHPLCARITFVRFFNRPLVYPARNETYKNRKHPFTVNIKHIAVIRIKKTGNYYAKKVYKRVVWVYKHIDEDNNSDSMTIYISLKKDLANCSPQMPHFAPPNMQDLCSVHLVPNYSQLAKFEISSATFLAT